VCDCSRFIAYSGYRLPSGERGAVGAIAGPLATPGSCSIDGIPDIHFFFEIGKYAFELV